MVSDEGVFPHVNIRVNYQRCIKWFDKWINVVNG